MKLTIKKLDFYMIIINRSIFKAAQISSKYKTGVFLVELHKKRTLGFNPKARYAIYGSSYDPQSELHRYIIMQILTSY